jgi:TIR domain
MHVFISWSMPRSKMIASAIREWLCDVIQVVDPWMSDIDIAAGTRWLGEISNKLEVAQIAIICITPENQNNPWLMFEAGALSKNLAESCVCPLLYDITPSLLDSPLKQFQAVTLDKESMGKILQTINDRLEIGKLSQQRLDVALDTWWPKLEAKLSSIPTETEVSIPRSTGE